MFTKTIIPAALALTLISFSGASFAETVHQGGPKGMTTARPAVAAIQANKPYAQVLPSDRATTNKHIYAGGPKATAPHAAR
jgi:hypothetical protein